MEKATNTSAADHGHDHVKNSNSSGSIDPDERKKKQLSASSNSDSETDAQSFRTQPFLKQKTSIPSTGSEGSSDAIPVVEFSSTEMARLQAQHQLSLFAKVFGKRVRLEKFSSHLGRIWSPEGRLDVSLLENDYFLLKFSQASDYNKAIKGVPWTIDYHYITLRQWSPNFKPSEAIITQVAVWIRLQELPVEYYDHEALPKIAAVIGRPVKVDPVTESRSKCKFARLCIELDLHKPLIQYVKLPNGVWQPIQYEGLHLVCYGCRRFGHFQENCSYRTSVPTPESTSPPPEQSTSQDPSRRSSSVYGPRLQVLPGQQWLRRFPYHSGHASGTGYSARGSRFQVPPDEPSDLGVNPEPDHAITTSPHVEKPIYNQNVLELSNLQIGEGTSSTLSNIKTPAQNKPAPTSSTQSQKTGEGTKGDIEAPYEPKVFPEYFSLNAPTLSSPRHPVPTPHQVLSTPPIPSVTGPQPVSSPRIEMYSQVVQRGVEKRELNIAPFEIKERSTEGCPTVFDIDPKVPKLDIDMKISPLSSGNGNLHHITITPASIDHTIYATPSSSPKKILSWNCRGASDPTRIRAMNDLCRAHNPSILLLLETRTSGIDADRVIKDLGFSGSYCIDPVDYTGGVWLLWRKEHINLKITSSASYHIHAVADLSPAEGYEPQEWIVYGFDSDEQ